MAKEEVPAALRKRRHFPRSQVVLRVQGSGFRMYGVGFRVQDSGFKGRRTGILWNPSVENDAIEPHNSSLRGVQAGLWYGCMVQHCRLGGLWFMVQSGSKLGDVSQDPTIYNFLGVLHLRWRSRSEGRLRDQD